MCFFKKTLERLRNCQKFGANGALKDMEWVALGVARRVGRCQWCMAPYYKPCHKLRNFLPYILFSQNLKSMKDFLFTNSLTKYVTQEVWTAGTSSQHGSRWRKGQGSGNKVKKCELSSIMDEVIVTHKNTGRSRGRYLVPLSFLMPYPQSDI